jgi:gliding motility-associated protein GldM
MALPKEPRQKMINLMYLVLTALLALNVSAEILNAFKVVDASLMTANATIDTKNKGVFKSFEQKLKDNETRERAEKWLPFAKQAASISEDMYKYLDGLKQELKKQADLEIVEGKEHYKEDNLDAATRMMVENKRGEELRNKLIAFKKQLLDIHPDVRAKFDKALPIDTEPVKTENLGNHDWSSGYFRMTPTIAAVTILSKFQNDIRNSEAMVIDFIHQKVGEVEIVYDQFAAFAGTNSQYLMPGQELLISAGVGAFSTAAKPTITVDGSPIALNADGVAEYKTNVGGPGSYSKTVKVTFLKPDGTQGVEEKKIEYTVGSPTGASVSADAVKVFYIGLKNPITVLGGTVGDEKVVIDLDNGRFTKTGAGKYIVEPARVGEATVTVNADGKKTPFKFRVKTVPDPVGMVGREKGGRVPANIIKAQQGIRAELENFIFEGVQFNVVGFTVYAVGAGFNVPGISPNPGAYFNAESKAILEKCRPGTTLVLDEIKAVGPGGDTRKLPPMVFNLY